MYTPQRAQTPPGQLQQTLFPTVDGRPITGTPSVAMLYQDPLECARKVAAIHALQFQMMPQPATNSFWQQPCTPWTGQGSSSNPKKPAPIQSCFTGITPWLPPFPGPFPMGITCDGIPIRKKAKRSMASEGLSPASKTPKKVEDGLVLMCDLSLGTLENSCSIPSTDTCENLESSIDADLFSLESFDLFSKDFDAFLNQMTNSSDDFQNHKVFLSEKSQASFLDPHVKIPRKRRSVRINQKRSLSKSRLRSFWNIIN